MADQIPPGPEEKPQQRSSSNPEQPTPSNPEQSSPESATTPAEQIGELLHEASVNEREAIKESIENLNKPSFFRRFIKELKQATWDHLASLGRSFYGITLAFVIAVLAPVLMTGVVSDKLEAMDSKLDSNVSGALEEFGNSDAVNQFSLALENQLALASNGQAKLNEHVQQFEGVLANSGETLQAQLQAFEGWMGQVDDNVGQLTANLNQIQGQMGSLNSLLQRAQQQEQENLFREHISTLQTDGQRFLAAASRADADYQDHRQWLKTVMYLTHSLPIANADLSLLQDTMQTVVAGRDEFDTPSSQIQEALTILEVLTLLSQAS